MAEQVHFEDVKEGDTIPELQKQPTSQQLVLWAAGSGDFYQIHYDTGFAQNNELSGIIVHGALKHAFLGDMLHRWIAPGGRVKRVACSYRGMDYPDNAYTIKGRITKTYEQGGAHLVDIEIWGENHEGQKTTPGTATVSLPSRG